MKHVLLASALATSLVLPVGWTVSAQADETEDTDAGPSRHKGFSATYKAHIGTAAAAVGGVVAGGAVAGLGVWKYMSGRGGNVETLPRNNDDLIKLGNYLYGLGGEQEGIARATNDTTAKKQAEDQATFYQNLAQAVVQLLVARGRACHSIFTGTGLQIVDEAAIEIDVAGLD